ncbi:hypothetical protein KO519_06860 [Paraglaciecola agarilytica]|uniref:CmcJ/NvfI family oxidoreductase n=1 Tax=Paraglaciecola chathamensis TaxID=368405 RepID=UPI001C08411D|nr:CmcJ/NvfI family oxidoreductase [Paraglaciecola agarilytica]MBU3017418.1 hypothetical protein [Paraglaciecola agarilytica]
MTTATVNYHVRSHAPQAFHFDVDGIVGSLISPELIATQVQVRDLRNQVNEVNFTEDGILFVTAKSKVNEFENGHSWKAVYEQELAQLLKQEIAAKEVVVFDHTVRVDDPNAKRRPARNVHNDYTQASVEKRLVDILGAERAAQFQQGHFGFVNVWRPVQYPVLSSPLGFIRPRSMLAKDWMNIELIYPDRQGQILGVAANPEHEWFYQSKMTPDEAIIFNIFDNTGLPHLAHSALDMTSEVKAAVPRKSIETRTLVKY